MRFYGMSVMETTISAYSNINDIGTNITLLGSATANASTASKSISLKSLSNYRFIYLTAEADNYSDAKLIPVKLLLTMDIIGGRGYNLQVHANDSYYWEGNVGFYSSNNKAEVITLSYSGWTPAIKIYGVK